MVVFYRHIWTQSTFFKNSYYKWLNERLLGIAHMYLFIFQSLSLKSDIRPFKIFYFVSIVTFITF